MCSRFIKGVLPGDTVREGFQQEKEREEVRKGTNSSQVLLRVVSVPPSQGTLACSYASHAFQLRAVLELHPYRQAGENVFWN